MAKDDSIKEELDVRREFKAATTGEENQSYFIASPTGEDIRKADWQYSKVYNRAIVDGFLTQAQMVNLLKDKGIINDEYTDRLETVRSSLAAELFKLDNLDKEVLDEHKEAIALEVAGLRDELFQMNQMVNGPLGNTCENLAEDARTEFLTSRIVQKKDGKSLWSDFEAYQTEANTNLSVKSRFEVMLWMQGLGSDFLENTPEQAALREIAQARLEKALAEVSAESEAADAAEAVAETQPVEEISLDKAVSKKAKKKPAKTVAKKRGRPKATAPKKKATTKKKTQVTEKAPASSEDTEQSE